MSKTASGKLDELRNLVIKNPTLLIKFFTSESCNSGNYSYEECFITSINVDEITLYNDDKWLNEEELREQLEWDLHDDELSEDELKNKIDVIISGTNFEKIICVFLG